MVTMKPFTEADWSAWAGCEGSDPKIGELYITGALAVYDGIIIADSAGVQIYLVDKNGDVQYRYVLDAKTQALANMIAANIPDNVGHAELIDLGFEQMKI